MRVGFSFAAFMFFSLFPLTAQPVAKTTAEATVGTTTFPSWTFASSGDAIGGSGMLIGEFDGNAGADLITSAALSNSTTQRFWSLSTFTEGLIQTQFTSGLATSRSITALIAADYDGDEQDELWVAYSDFTIDVFDPLCHAPIVTIDLSVTLTSWSRVFVTDIDNDDTLEVVTVGAQGVSIFAGSTPFALEQVHGTYVNHDMVVGQMDDDLLPEIALVGGSRSYVIEYDGTVEWEYLLGFGNRITTGDIDADGRDEIIGDVGNSVVAFDVEQQIVKWDTPFTTFFSGFVVGNINNQAGSEIIGWNSQNSNLNVFSGADGEPLGTFGVDELSSISGLTLGEADSSGRQDIIAAGEREFNRESTLVAVNYTNNSLQFQNTKLPGPLHQFAVADRNNDGSLEIMVAPPEYETSVDPRLFILNGTTRAVIDTLPFLGGGFTIHSQTLIAVDQLDGDAAMEIVFVATETFNTVIRIYDGALGAVQATSGQLDDDFSQITTADVDADGTPELIAVSTNRIHLFDATTLSETWRSPTVNFATITHLTVANTDDDEALEIMVGGNSTDILFFDGVTGQLQDDVEGSYTAVTVTDIDGDTVNEILLGTNSGTVEVWRGSPPSLVTTRDPGLGVAVKGIRYGLIDDHTDPLWFLATAAAVTVTSDSTAEQVWQSQYGMASAATGNQLLVVDPDGDGTREIMVGGSHALASFEVDCGAPLLRARLNHWQSPWLITDYVRLITCASP